MATEFLAQIEQQSLPEDKVVTLAEFAALRNPNVNYSLLSGSFDLLHPNHLQALKSVLEHAPTNSPVVALDTDEYIWRRKGKLPLLPFEIRSLQLATVLQLSGRDGYVIKYDPQGDNSELIKTVQPQIMMYSEPQGREKDLALLESLGGKGLFLKRGTAEYNGGEVSSSVLRGIIRERINRTFEG